MVAEPRSQCLNMFPPFPPSFKPPLPPHSDHSASPESKLHWDIATMAILECVAGHLPDLHERIEQSGDDKWLLTFPCRVFHYVLQFSAAHTLRPKQRLGDSPRLLLMV